MKDIDYETGDVCFFCHCEVTEYDIIGIEGVYTPCCNDCLEEKMPGITVMRLANSEQVLQKIRQPKLVVFKGGE